MYNTKTILILLFLFVTTLLHSQIEIEGSQGRTKIIESGHLLIKLDRYGHGEHEGYRALVDVGSDSGVYKAILIGGRIAHFITPMKLILHMDNAGFEYLGIETYVLKKNNKDKWVTVWIFYK